MDLNQTLYGEWKQVSDEPCCLVSRFSDHSRSGPLISSQNMAFSYTFRTGDRNSSWISTKLGMMNENKLVMSPFVWCHGPVITAVLVDWFLEQNMTFSYTFHIGDRNSSWISIKLYMVNENKLVMSPIVWCHGSVTTAVLVHWFLEQNMTKYDFRTLSALEITI